MAKIKFNVNDYVYVKLNDIGWNELELQHKELRKEIHGLPAFEKPDTDSEGFSKFQMHDLMHRFGHLMGVSDGPFDVNIKFEIREGF